MESRNGYVRQHIGKLMAVVAVTSSLYLLVESQRKKDQHYSQRPTESFDIIQKNILGNHRPEVYIEWDGVRYFSHVDGKEISDLVK